jgi:quercetin dioxygenase-like cupin family protein
MTASPDGPEGVIDFAGLAKRSGDGRPVWAGRSEDFNLNLVVLDGGPVAEHVNTQVDVLLIGVEGEGYVEIDGVRQTVGAGQGIVIPKGAARSIGSTGDRFAYLACHRRRPALWPEGVPRPGGG